MADAPVAVGGVAACVVLLVTDHPPDRGRRRVAGAVVDVVCVSLSLCLNLLEYIISGHTDALGRPIGALGAAGSGTDFPHARRAGKAGTNLPVSGNAHGWCATLNPGEIPQ